MTTEANNKDLARRLRALSTELLPIAWTKIEAGNLRALFRQAADVLDPPKAKSAFTDEEWRDHFLPAYYPLRTKGLPPDTPKVPEALTGTLRPAIDAGIAAVEAFRRGKWW